MVAAMRKPTSKPTTDPIRRLQADKAVAEARRLREEGKLEQAAGLVASVAQAEPQHLGALKLMGSLAMHTGATEIAIGCFSQALTLSPKSMDVLFELGNSLVAGHRPAEAVSVFRKALALRPNDGAVYRGLGQAQLDMGDRGNALKSFRKTLSILPYDQYAAHMIAALSGETASGATGYVADLFDSYADAFDKHLTDTLEYRIPEAIRELLERRTPKPRLQSLLDLGCGTGLVGLALNELIPAKDGIDIAPQMVGKAAARGIYRHLKTGDAVALLAEDADFSGPYDVIAAADVFVYLGRLEPAFAAIAQAVARGGLFAFSVETTHDDDMTVRSSGRFSHSAAYIARLAADHGFSIAHHRDIVIRQERNEPIAGALYLLARD